MGNNIAFSHFLSLLDIYGIQMAVKSEECEAVIDDHEVAIDAEVAGICNDAVIGGLHWGICRGSKVDAHVDALADCLGLGLIFSLIAEQGHGSGILHPEEYAFP